MKNIALTISSVVLILALILSVGLTGCTKKTETTTSAPVVTTTAPPATTTAAPPATTTAAPPATTSEQATLSSIKVTPASPADLTAGSTQLFNATATNSDGSTRELFSVTWNSDNPSVATISRDGLAKGVAAGKANITATLSGITSPPVSLTVVAGPETETPPETTTSGVIPWQEAKNHIGETITVEGPIIDKFDIGTAMLLGMGKSATDSGTVGIEISYSLASELPADLFVGLTIKATGLTYINPLGGCSLKVNAASDIEVVE